MDTRIALKDQQELSGIFEQADSILKRTYLSNLNCYPLDKPHTFEVPVSQLGEYLNSSVRFFELTQVVINKNENVRDKLMSVFNAVGNTAASLLVQIKGSPDKVCVRIGIKSSDNNIDSTALAQDVLEHSLTGNFPGTRLRRLKAEQLQTDIINEFSATQAVVTVTDIAGIRSEDETKERLFMQGIEKVIDAMRGHTYTLFLIADPLNLSDLNVSRRALETMYSQLLPFSGSNYSFGTNETDTINSSITQGVANTLSTSIANTVSHTVGKSVTATMGQSVTTTDSTSETVTDGTSSSNSVGITAGGVIPTPLPLFIGGSTSHTVGTNHSTSKGTSHSVARGVSSSTAYGSNFSDATGATDTKGQSISESRNYTEGTAKTTGSTESMQIKFENHSIQKVLERIDIMLERYDECADMGMWNCAAYCIADKVTAQMLASIYRSVIRGKNSSLEDGAITVCNKEKIPAIMDFLRRFEHPHFIINGFSLTPAAIISSKELAIHAGLPNHSVPGLPVFECAEFGRAVVRHASRSSTEYGKSIRLGNIYHMHAEEILPVTLDTNSLASHTFITGSTGSGKSNTIYQILTEAKKSRCRFLVIEPAKGEYKHIFGMQEDVAVYGTNPALTPLLRINPFKFPKGIHILEHLDRLVEIFNVCWPMYAAMPAVLKEAVARSYQDAGWDLTESKNPYGENLYPSFADVVRNVRIIIDSSDYDAENKGAYKGSLITRLRSLTNGLNGLIFTNDAITDSDLFDKNVIVDLSRVGSTETKSLMMGILVMQLQEYRMTSGRLNADLMHVTVLEEAHHLLKRTAMEQSNETVNLLGKSVEMLGNAIAEMRTYGEGFIIADQAPGLLDMAVIRNTNTKVIMRLPDLSDRELVGKAAGLNDDQIIELGKLPLGVAAVYQNDWIEPVLCKVAHHRTAEQHYAYTKPPEEKQPQIYTERLSVARFLCNPDSISPAEKTRLMEIIRHLNIRAVAVVQLQKYIHEPPKMPRFTKIAPIISALFPEIKQAFTESFSRTDDEEQWSRDVDETIQRILHLNSEEQLSKDIRQCIITDYLHNELGKTELLEKWSKEGGIN